MGWMKDETGLEKRPANFVPLTPLSHLIRAARVFPERTAVVDGAFPRDLCRVSRPRHATGLKPFETRGKSR
jgi:hypothetical protein